MRKPQPPAIKRPDNGTIPLTFYKVEKKSTSPQTITLEEYKKTVKKKKNHPEDEFQKWVIKYLRHEFPDLIIFHPANGGKRTKTEAGIFKALGVLSGCPDVIIISESHCDFPVVFIELKSEDGRQTESQRDFQIKAEKLGYAYFLCRTKEDVIHYTDETLK